MIEGYFFSAFYYLLFSLPGFLLLWMIHRFNLLSGLLKHVTVSFIAAIFFTPFYIVGHLTFVAPVYVAFVLPFARELVDPLWLFGGPLIVFAGTLATRLVVRKKSPVAAA